jgi:glutamine synthetase
MLSGRTPYAGDNSLAVMAQAPSLRAAAARPRMQPGVSPQLAAIVARCLLRKPDDRYDDVAALVDALDHPEAADLSLLDRADEGGGASFFRSPAFKGIAVSVAFIAAFIASPSFSSSFGTGRQGMDSFEKTRFELMSLVQRNKVKYLELQFTDVAGMVKNLTIPAGELDASLSKGIWFDGSSIEGYARVAESDMYLMPDPSTFAIVPWRSKGDAIARLICNVHTPDDQPFGGDPRAALIRAVQDAKAMGLSVLHEPRDGVLPPPHGPWGRDRPARAPRQRRLFRRILGHRRPAPLPADVHPRFLRHSVEAMHHEVAGGQHEVDFLDADSLSTADNVITFRLALKAIAQRNGLYGTFMPKPIEGMSGSGMHVHQSMSYAANGADAFSDPGDPHGLSKIAKHFIAGQLAHAKGMCAILAPLVNSYKRLVAGYEAPVHLSWARINRAALIRVPRSAESGRARMELRCPDPSCNPYLAFTVMLAAGLDGIRRELPAIDATEENPYSVEQSRGRARIPPARLPRRGDRGAGGGRGGLRRARAPHSPPLHRGQADRMARGDCEVTPWEIAKYLPNY